MRAGYLLLALLLVGCATVQVSNYIRSDHPYTRRIYASFDQVHEAVKAVLTQQGFSIEQEVDPSEYERDERYDQPGTKNILMFTNVKQLPRVAYSKFIHLNVYLRSFTDSTEVEIRYAQTTSVLVKQIKGTSNNAYVNGLLDKIEASLGK